MSRSEKAFEFWQGQKPNLKSMYLTDLGSELDVVERPEILSYLPQFKDKIVLELAAGIGRFTGDFAALAEKVVAVDFVPKFIRANQKRNALYSNVEYLCSDVMCLDLEEKSFDLIFMNWLLMYLEDEEVELLAERFSRWLKPGGHLFFRETCSLNDRYFEEGYFVRYRNWDFYTELFTRRFQLVRHDSIKTYDYRFANPFHRFWYFRLES